MEITLFCLFLTLIPITVLAVSNAQLWIELKSMQKSTHQIQFVDPMAQQFSALTDAQKQSLQEDPFNSIQ